MNNFVSILHASVIVKDVSISEKFYCEILGMSKNKNRADLPYAGLWIDIGESQIHLLQVDNPDTTTNRPEHGGRDRHVAIQVQSINKIKDALQSSNINFTMSKSGRTALFCRDPDGNALEFMEV